MYLILYKEYKILYVINKIFGRARLHSQLISLKYLDLTISNLRLIEKKTSEV